MPDSRTAQGVGKMFPGTLGGQARPAQPQTPPIIPRLPWPRPSPPILYDTQGIFHYYHWLFGPPDGDEEDIVYNPYVGPGTSLYEGPGVSHAGLGYFGGGFNLWYCPPITNAVFDLWFDFSERYFDDSLTVDAADPITRDLHLVLVRDSDSVTLVDQTQSYTGTRGSTLAHLHRGPYNLPDAFTIHSYCNFETMADRSNVRGQNVYTGGSTIYVSGTFL